MDFSALEKQYGLPAGILGRMEQTESGGNQFALSNKGAEGYFQFLPGTAKQYNVDPYNLNSAAQGAARYLADLYKQTGSMEKAVAAYNWGPGNLAKFGYQNAPAETKAYVRKVMGDVTQPTTLTMADMNAMWDKAHPTKPTTLTMADMNAMWDKAHAPGQNSAKSPAPEAPDNASWYKALFGPRPMPASPTAPNPVGVGFGPLEGQIAKGAAIPYLNAAAMIPGVGQSAADTSQQFRQTTPAWAQMAGGALGSVPLAVAAGALAPLGAAVGVPAALTGTAIGAGLGAATSAPGERATGAVLGGALSAIPGVYGAAKGIIGRRLAPGGLSDDAAKILQATQKEGFVAPPSGLTGTSRFLQQVTSTHGPFAKNVPEQNTKLFVQKVMNTLGAPKDTPLTAQGLNSAMQGIRQRMESRLAGVSVPVAPDVVNVVNNVVGSNRAMQAALAIDPQSRSIAGVLERASGGQPIAGTDYVRVLNWIGQKAHSVNDPATKDALQEIKTVWENAAPAKIKPAVRAYNLKMSQAMDLLDTMSNAKVAAGVQSVNPGALYRSMARGKPSVPTGAHPYNVAKLAQQADAAELFGNGSRTPEWLERAAAVEGLGALGSGEVRAPYLGKLNFAQQALGTGAYLASKGALKTLATPEGQKMFLTGYKLTPEDIKFLSRMAATGGAMGGLASSSIAPNPQP